MTPEVLAAGVKTVVFDVDGVLTDGGLWYGVDGESQKRFDVKDGHAIVMARLAGLPVAWLTARDSRLVAHRAAELKVAQVFQGRRDKGAGLVELCDVLGVAPGDCAYMGDDVNDLPAMRQVRLAACPADAVAEVRSAAQFVSLQAGGHGAARELIELVLKATGRWSDALAHMK